MTEREALKLALEALEKSLPRLAPYGEQDWLDSKEAITAIKEALSSCQCPECRLVLHASDCAVHSEPAYPKGECNCGAQPEQGYTTKRNEWTNQVTHKCNACGRDDFRSENAAKFHKCEGIEEPKQHSQNKLLNIYTTPPQRTWVGLTDEEAQQTFAKHNCTISTHLAGILARAIEAKLKEKNTHD